MDCNSSILQLGGGDGPQIWILSEMFYSGIFEGRKICVQLNLSTTATLRTEESGRCREVWNKSQCMDFFVPRDKKSGLCLQVAVSRGSTVQYIWSAHIFQRVHLNNMRMKYNQTCFAFWKVLRLGNLAFNLFKFFFLGGGVGRRGELVIGSVFFDSLWKP